MLFKQTTAVLIDLVWSSSEDLKEENIFLDCLFFLSKLSRDRARADIETLGAIELTFKRKKERKGKN